MRQTLETDGELDPVEVTLGLAQEIAAQVWGQGFPAARVRGRIRALLEQRLVGDKHLRLALLAGGRPCAAMLFNEPGPLPERIRAAYRLEVNHYQGLSSLQFVLERWQTRLSRRECERLHREISRAPWLRCGDSDPGVARGRSLERCGCRDCYYD